MKIIKSSQNPLFKKLLSLKHSKGIKKEGLCLAAGKVINEEILSSFENPKKIHFSSDSSPDLLLEKTLFNQLAPFKTQDPIFLCPAPQLPPVILEADSSPIGSHVLLPAGDPKNLGALIRSCMAFNVQQIILLKESANPFLPEAIKASAGSVFNAPLFLGPSLKDLPSLKEMYTLDKSGDPIDKMKKKPSSFYLLIGEEGGFHYENSSQKISISISEKVESLNVNSCLSIALYELNKIS